MRLPPKTGRHRNKRTAGGRSTFSADPLTPTSNAGITLGNEDIIRGDPGRLRTVRASCCLLRRVVGRAVNTWEQLQSRQQTTSEEGLQTLFQEVLAGPELFLSSLDLSRDSLRFTPMSLETYRSSDFLDHRMDRTTGSDVTVGANAFVALFDRVKPEQKPLSFIFHTGYCCSTLLARCLEHLSDTLVLKEPAPLRRLSESWFTAPKTHDLRKFNRIVAIMLARRYREEAVVVKTTSHCINMLPELFDLHSHNRAVFLLPSLEESLVCYLKDPLRRREARFYLGYLGELVPPDLPLGPHLAITDAQIVALLWMIQVRFYYEIAKPLARERLVVLNSSAFLDDPAQTLRRVVEHFGISATEQDLRQVLESDVFNRYAKGRHLAFNKATRRAHLEWIADIYAREVEFAVNWAKSLPIWPAIDANLPSEFQAGI